ncbi:MAG TPA: lysophospholipid acyltransferase family protein [Terriglobales bacterium]|nr:lysophospholipid acyltransferase family protein [Terriglobales bacterium]
MIAALRTAASLLFIVIFTSLGALIGFPATWITGSADLLYSIAMWIVRNAVRIAGIEIEIEGLEQIDPEGTYIYMCNHVSNLDPPVLIPKLPQRTSVLVKKELFKVPILGQAMRAGDLVPVDRSNREAAVASMKEAERAMSAGLSMTIFPEGTRSPDGRLLPFKKGPFYLAMDSGIPVVPVTICGSERLMPKGHTVIQPGTVRLIFHSPILPSSFRDNDELIEAVRRQIECGLAKCKQEFGEVPGHERL